ncbi:AraC-like DNA-binding protein [Tenacibaculum adriaticum]|uniref:AraC-like DNA-binding protein n=1 Tax=Tenacibaculum adriaticum TaxID=413713 RepID=A0A5S5E0B6_9FLAO|nr:AraC family transcriptional regulator [Tenacibaculum adriaticum]TYQ00190.1 AraC-like DNA-binding protein [Tenacibaculum adriaticum]
MIDRSKDLQPNILTEQFIPDHVFVYLEKGELECYDGSKNYTFKEGDICIARKNRLARYKVKSKIEYKFFCFGEDFLKIIQKKHNLKPVSLTTKDTFLKILNNELLLAFIQSLSPYFENNQNIDKTFQDIKYEELLFILLKIQPELAGLFFDFSVPHKIDLELFMMKNFTFNVSLQRFAFLTGRSLSAFKRDFKTVFNDTPSRWLTQKRLQEAYYLIDKKNKRPSEIYLDLGFEALSHFSFAFKKYFGLTPSDIIERKANE